MPTVYEVLYEKHGMSLDIDIWYFEINLPYPDESEDVENEKFSEFI